MIRILVLLFGLLSLEQALALSPEEQLADPELESRAREISAQMRCLVCQNQSIEDSEAGLAQDLRLEVRRLLLKGQSDTEIITAIQQKYGDYVLLNPPMKAETLLLWLSPVLIVLIGAAVLWQHFRISKVSTVTASSRVEIAEAAPLKGKSILLMLTLVFLLSAGGYVLLEHSGVVGNYQEAAQVEEQVATMVEGLAERMQDDPDNLEGWQQLARSYAVLDQPTETIDALIQVARLMPQDWQAQTFPLEMILARGLSEDYQTPAQELLVRLGALDQERLEYRFFAGHYAKLAGNVEQARAYWQKLYDRLPKNAPILEQLQRGIEGL